MRVRLARPNGSIALAPDKPDDNGRHRRKQAEFLVWLERDWSLIETISIINMEMLDAVRAIMRQNPARTQHALVQIQREWY